MTVTSLVLELTFGHLPLDKYHVNIEIMIDKSNDNKLINPALLCDLFKSHDFVTILGYRVFFLFVENHFYNSYHSNFLTLKPR